MAEAYFRFIQGRDPGKSFVIKLTDPAKIEQARRILSGKETAQTHVLGRIRKQPVPYNPGWDYHLDSDSIGFFEVAIEVCDANMQYVEDHLDEAGGPFLPGCFWCPWDSRLVEEVQPAQR
ncbi:MAG: hypothetical protein JO212_14995 [Acetobacteraceae bacterium]|nr:hypothetical protein [Acetobacteraceae bacterium]MBV8591338.1 hypothetical protein [Acetobacteraceae bacterium]